MKRQLRERADVIDLHLFCFVFVFFGLTSHKEITLAAVGRIVCRVQKQKQGNHYAAYHGSAVRGHRLWE